MIAVSVVIAVAAVWGIVKTSSTSAASSSIVAILNAATAIGTMTTAYFGIKSVTNTAQSYVPQGSPGQGPGQGSPGQGRRGE